MPQAHTVPSLLSASVWKPPPATAVTSVNPPTCTGVLIELSEELVAWPALFEPQPQTVPSAFTASVCSSPAPMARTPAKTPAATTSVVTVAELFDGSGSSNRPAAVAVLTIFEPAGAVTFTTSVKGMSRNVPAFDGVMVTVPPAPTGGAVQVPPPEHETKVVPGGSWSVMAAARS